MKESRAEVEATLAERRQRLADLENRGADALSRYDKEIAFGGDIERALSVSKQLVRNHIAYWERKLVELPPEQSKLF